MATHIVSLGWQASTDSVQGYNVYSAANAPGTEKANPPLNGSTLITGTTFDATVPSPGVYEFVVTAVEGGAESVISNEVTATVPPFPPTNLVVSAIN
jgi:hypothetical protein